MQWCFDFTRFEVFFREELTRALVAAHKIDDGITGDALDVGFEGRFEFELVMAEIKK